MTNERAGERYKREEEKRSKLYRRRFIIGCIVFSLLAGTGALVFFGKMPKPAPAEPVQQRVFKPLDDYFARAEGLFPIYEIYDQFGGVTLLKSDIDRAINQQYGSRANLPDGAEQQLVERLRLRHAMASRAIGIGLSDETAFQAAVRRYYLDTLAGQYLNMRLTAAVEVKASEVETFIAENPDLFKDRKRLAFDAIDIPLSAYDALDSSLIRNAKSMDDILIAIKGLGIPFRRRPFAAYSEELPAELLQSLDRIITDGETVFVKSGGQATVMRLLSVDPATIAANEQFDLAEARLTTLKRAEALAGVEAEIRARLLEREAEINPVIQPQEGDPAAKARGSEDAAKEDEAEDPEQALPAG